METLDWSELNKIRDALQDKSIPEDQFGLFIAPEDVPYFVAECQRLGCPVTAEWKPCPHKPLHLSSRGFSQ